MENNFYSIPRNVFVPQETSPNFPVEQKKRQIIFHYPAPFCTISGFLLAVSRDILPNTYMPPESLSPRRRLTVTPWCGRSTLPSTNQSQ